MVLTMALLACVYAGMLVGLSLADLGTEIVFAIALVVVAVQLAVGDRLALRAVGATVVPRAARPELHAIVDRVCMQADLPKPAVAVADSEVPNALAVGRTREGATICVTWKMLEVLEPHELEAVIAHELAHVQNRDALVMTLASFFSLVAALVLRIGAQVGHVAARLATIGIAIAGWALSTVLLRTLSRYRELSADRAAALITGRPSALASALLKVDAAVAAVPKKDLREVQPVAALCFAPLRGRDRRFSWLTATHPSTERRVAALHALEEQLQGSGPRPR